jgi:hypothetical protein
MSCFSPAKKASIIAPQKQTPNYLPKKTLFRISLLAPNLLLIIFTQKPPKNTIQHSPDQLFSFPNRDHSKNPPVVLSHSLFLFPPSTITGRHSFPPTTRNAQRIIVCLAASFFCDSVDALCSYAERVLRKAKQSAAVFVWFGPIRKRMWKRFWRDCGFLSVIWICCVLFLACFSSFEREEIGDFECIKFEVKF